MKPSLLILAAGMGSRYWGLKQIDPIGPHNEVIIDYSLYDARRAGFEKIVFVIRKDIEKDFKEFFGQRFDQHFQVEYVYQQIDDIPAGFAVPAGRTKPWWTGQAILVAKDVIHEPFAVINADDFYGRESFEAMYKFLSQNTDDSLYAMIGYHLKNTISPHGTVNRWVCTLDAQGDLVTVIETKDISADMGNLSPETIVSMNFFGFMPSFFTALEQWFTTFLQEHGQEEKSEYYIPFELDHLITQQKAICKVIPNPALWFGVTYKEDKPEVVANIQRLIAEGVYPDRLR